MREHDQGDVAVESGPQASLVVIEAELPFGILVEAFDHPTHVRDVDQIREGELVEADAEVDLFLTSMPLQGPFGEQPAVDGEERAARTSPEHTRPRDALDQRPLLTMPPGDRLPRLARQAIDDLTHLARRDALVEADGLARPTRLARTRSLRRAATAPDPTPSSAAHPPGTPSCTAPTKRATPNAATTRRTAARTPRDPTTAQDQPSTPPRPPPPINDHTTTLAIDGRS